MDNNNVDMRKWAEMGGLWGLREGGAAGVGGGRMEKGEWRADQET